MKKTIKITLGGLFLALFLLPNKGFTQEQEKVESKLQFNRFSFGLNFGSLLTYGDIKQYDFWPTPDERKWGGGVVLNYQISPVFSLQGQALAGNLSGIKRKFTSGAPANLKFNAEIYERSINATVSLNRWWVPHLKLNNKVNFYAIIGIGLVDFRTQQRGLKDDKFISSFGYSDQGAVKEKMTTETVVPLGFGIKYKVTDKIDISIESTIRNVNTDKFDAYVRANNAQDKYGYTFVGISYKFGKYDKHMEWTSSKELEAAKDMLALDSINKDIDEINNKITQLENKTQTSQPTDQIDIQELAEIKQKIEDINSQINELDNKIVNMQPQIARPDTSLKSPVLPSSVLSPSVLFEFNKATINKVNYEKIAAVAQLLIYNPNIKIELIGHADKTGGQRYNELLSEKRGKAVYDVLIKDFGIDPSRLSISYKGFSNPLSKQNYDLNRRVEFIIK